MCTTNDTCVIVPSCGRHGVLMDRGLTLAWASHLTVPVYLLVHNSESQHYARVASQYNVQLITHDCTTVSRIRDYAIDFAEDYTYLWLLDDDLLFSYRDWNSTKLPRLPYDQLQRALTELKTLVNEGCPLAGLRHRMFAHSCKEPVEYNKRVMWTPLLHLPTFRASGWRYAWEGDFMEDFRMQCMIVRNRRATAVLNSYVANDALGAWREGGCNTYRTLAGRSRAATLLFQEYPEYVSLVQRQSPTQLGESYMDVRLRLPRIPV